MLVLEELEHARARGAKIYAEVLGYGVSSDASHVSDPDPSGANPARAMRMAFADAGIEPEVVGYVNAHGTSTPSGDSAETRVLKLALGEEKAFATPVSSTKGATGHCLGAAGAVEAIFTIFALQRGVLPPTINYEVPDPDLRPRLHPERGAPAGDRGRRVQLVRLRRAQRVRRVPPLGRSGLGSQRRSSRRTVSRQTPSSCAIRSKRPTRRNPRRSWSATLAAFSGNMPAWIVQIPPASALAISGLHERASDSAAPRALRDVDRALGDAGVARPRRRRSESDPAHDAAVVDGDEPVLGVVARSRTRRSREAPSRTSLRGSRCPRRRSPRPRASRLRVMGRISTTAGRLGLRHGAVGDVRLLRDAGRLERRHPSLSSRSSSASSSRTGSSLATTSSSRRSRPTNPGASYREVLTIALEALADETGLTLPEGEASALARSLPDWPVFEDVRPGLTEAHERGWQLAILSNTDRDLIDASMEATRRPLRARDRRGRDRLVQAGAPALGGLLRDDGRRSARPRPRRAEPLPRHRAGERARDPVDLDQPARRARGSSADRRR